MIHTPFKEATKGMTFREKIEHFLTYYKWVLVVLAAVIAIISIVVTGIVNSRIETLYSGMLVNTFITEEGNAYLSEDLFSHLGGIEKKQQVNVEETYLQDMSSASNVEDKYMSAMKVTVMVAAQELDYIMMNETAYDYYENETVFPPLTEVLPAELLEQLQDNIVYYTDPDGTAYPMAIDITDCAFVQDCINADGRIYLAFCGNTGRTERNSVFVEYLLNWK